MSTWYMKRRLENEHKQEKGSDVTVATFSVDEKPIEEKKVAKKKVKKED